MVVQYTSKSLNCRILSSGFELFRSDRVLRENTGLHSKSCGNAKCSALCIFAIYSNQLPHTDTIQYLLILPFTIILV